MTRFEKLVLCCAWVFIRMFAAYAKARVNYDAELRIKGMEKELEGYIVKGLKKEEESE